MHLTAPPLVPVSGLVLLIVDAVQRFQQESLQVYIDQAGKLADAVQRWFLIFGVSLDAGMILEVLKQQVPPVEIVRGTLTLAVDSLGNALLILLVVLYLLAEHSNNAPGRCGGGTGDQSGQRPSATGPAVFLRSLRAKVDSQIQRYVVIKTAISALQGLLVYLVMVWRPVSAHSLLSDLFSHALFLPASQGYFLNVRMSHLFAVAHFLLNYIPTVMPVCHPFWHNALPQPEVVFVRAGWPHHRDGASYARRCSRSEPLSCSQSRCICG